MAFQRLVESKKFARVWISKTWNSQTNGSEGSGEDPRRMIYDNGTMSGLESRLRAPFQMRFKHAPCSSQLYSEFRLFWILHTDKGDGNIVSLFLFKLSHIQVIDDYVNWIFGKFVNYLVSIVIDCRRNSNIFKFSWRWMIWTICMKIDKASFNELGVDDF